MPPRHLVGRHSKDPNRLEKVNGSYRFVEVRWGDLPGKYTFFQKKGYFFNSHAHFTTLSSTQACMELLFGLAGCVGLRLGKYTALPNLITSIPQKWVSDW